LADADARMRARLGEGVDLGEGVIQAAVALVPAEWFAGGDPPEAYVEYLTRRLASDGFVEEAERARVGG
jgi:hypothetical protein